MEGRTLSIAAFNTKLDDNYEIITQDPEERAKIEKGMKATELRIEKDMDPVLSAAQMDTDEVVRFSELRDWLCSLTEMAYQASGHRRIKNPRIWSIHDFNVLTQFTAGQVSVQEEQTVETTQEIPAGMKGIIAQMHLQHCKRIVANTQRTRRLFCLNHCISKSPFQSQLLKICLATSVPHAYKGKLSCTK